VFPRPASDPHRRNDDESCDNFFAVPDKETPHRRNVAAFVLILFDLLRQFHDSHSHCVTGFHGAVTL